MKQPKYQPLQDYLLSGNGQNYKLSFKQIEMILKFSLPPSASKHQVWWANEKLETTRQPQKKSWLGAGYKTENLDLKNQTIEFIKI